MSSRVLNASIQRIPNSELKIRTTHTIPTNILPLSVDLRPRMRPVQDHGSLGGSAHAIVSAYQFAYPTTTPSALFVYYNSKGANTLGNALKCVQAKGFCAESDWPYDVANVNVQPGEHCYTSSQLRGCKVENICQDLNSMLNALHDGIPFLANIATFPAFVNTIVAKTGKIPLPARDAKPIGGHTILVCGYDCRIQQWICQNSWGKDWGEKGYCYLPFLYLLDSSLCSDVWCLSKTDE